MVHLMHPSREGRTAIPSVSISMLIPSTSRGVLTLATQDGLGGVPPGGQAQSLARLLAPGQGAGQHRAGGVEVHGVGSSGCAQRPAVSVGAQPDTIQGVLREVLVAEGL